MRSGRDIDEAVQFQTARRGDPPLRSPASRCAFLTERRPLCGSGFRRNSGSMQSILTMPGYAPGFYPKARSLAANRKQASPSWKILCDDVDARHLLERAIDSYSDAVAYIGKALKLLSAS